MFFLCRRRIDSDNESSPLSEVLKEERKATPSTSKSASSASKKIKTEKKSEAAHDCKDCNQQFLTESSFQMHLKSPLHKSKVKKRSSNDSVSYKYEPRQCPVCKKWFVSEFSFSAHMETHSVGEKKRNIGAGELKKKSAQKKSEGKSKEWYINEVVVNVDELNENLLNPNDLKRLKDFRKRGKSAAVDEVKNEDTKATKELIAKQEAEIAKLRKDLDREKVEQEKKTQQIVELEKETKNSKLSSDTLISELEAKLKNERDKCKELDKDSQVQVLAMKMDKEKLEKTEKLNKSLNLKIDAYNNKNNSLRKELSKQESENKELKQQQEKFQKSEKEVEELKKSVFEKDSKIKKLNQEKAHVDSELSSRKNESEDRKNQIEILKDELEKLQNESKKVQENSFSNLTAENSEEFEKLKNENSKYAKTDNTLREAIKKLQMQLKDKRQELNLKDEKIQRLEKEQKENQNVDNMPNEDEKIKEFRRREIEKQQQLEKIEEENLKLIQQKTKDSREILAGNFFRIFLGLNLPQ